MKTTWLGRFWGEHSDALRAPDEISPELRGALGDLERLVAERRELEAACRTLVRVLEAGFGRRAHPLLGINSADTTATFDAAARDDFDERAVAIAAALGSEGVETAAELARIFREEPGRAFSLAELGFRNDEKMFVGAADELRVDPVLASSVLRIAMLPALAGWSRELCERLGDGVSVGGMCPACGSPPAFAESRGLEQRRRLRCDRCAGDWASDHFHCPFCGQSDHRALRYRYVESEKLKYRLSICDGCGGRLKVVATIAAVSAPGLLVAQLAMIHLDWIDVDDDPDAP